MVLTNRPNQWTATFSEMSRIINLENTTMKRILALYNCENSSHIPTYPTVGSSREALVISTIIFLTVSYAFGLKNFSGPFWKHSKKKNKAAILLSRRPILYAIFQVMSKAQCTLRTIKNERGENVRWRA